MTISVVESKYKHNREYSFIRMICNLNGVIDENLSYKLYVVLKDLTSFKTDRVNKNSLDSYTSKSEYFSNTHYHFLNTLQDAGLIIVLEREAVFNKILFLENYDDKDLALQVDFNDNSMKLTNMTNYRTLVRSNVGIAEYLEIVTHFNKRSYRKDEQLFTFLNLFKLNEQANVEQLIITKPLVQTSVELGFGKEMLRTKLKAFVESGLVIESEDRISHVFNPEIKYLPTKHYLNPDFLTVSEVNGETELNRSFKVSITDEDIGISVNE